MQFHETFWAVVGTAAPVIALASAVSFPKVTRSMAAEGWPNHGSNIVLTTIANIFAQAASLAIALLSLADQTNYAPQWVAIAISVAGVMVIGYQAIVVQASKDLRALASLALDELEAYYGIEASAADPDSEVAAPPLDQSASGAATAAPGETE